MSDTSAGQGPALSEGLGHAEPERAWLVEWRAHGYGPKWWGFNFTPSEHADWCSDANNAVRFSREEDAERVRLHIIASADYHDRHRVAYGRSITVTEHEWPNVGVQPPVPRSAGTTG